MDPKDKATDNSGRMFLIPVDSDIISSINSSGTSQNIFYFAPFMFPWFKQWPRASLCTYTTRLVFLASLRWNPSFSRTDGG